MARFARILAGVFCLAAAHADVAPNPPKETEKVPQSVWQVAPDGTATHLQSTLVCAPEVAGFRQVHLQVYDRHGFDVSCGYNGRGGVITLYLTRLGAMSLDAAFADAKQQLVQSAPDAKPLPEADQKTFEGARDFLHLIYTEKNGALWSGIWMADFSGWMFEFRATYKPEAQQEIFDEMAELTRRAKADAGAHLALCAKSAVPERTGKPLTEDADITMIGVAAGATIMADALPDADKKDLPKSEKPGVWCAETPVEGFAIPLLLWHAVTADGKTQGFDRVSVTTYDTSPMLEAGAGGTGRIFDEIKNDGTTHFIVTLRNGDDVLVFGAWSGRPKPEDLGRLIRDFFDGRAKPLAVVNVKTKAITIYQGPKK
ncbi:hypothetical protein [Rhizomicrobium electricum]|uniref:Uncharacterized protein n=1 Tax=Rhizomicrobium electricum TaxID=480070 RepID=A0ABP3QGI5_9PROT|nr:hypothetical protein [Rhizomicrobium electricum]NIJ49186.1 hypothetical protein [Rhizomicrobium electricum]